MTGPRIFTPDYYARMRSLESSAWWNAGMRDVAAMLLATVGLPDRGTVLDVGCGSDGTMAWWHANHPDWRPIGLDVSLDGLVAARAMGLALSKASALRLPHPSGSVDLIISFDVLQHLPLDGGDVLALAEMHRVLRSDGIFLLRTNAQAFPKTVDDRAADFHKYRQAELRAKLVAAGFTVLRLSRINALMGLAEIPRELRATRRNGTGYHGILAKTSTTVGLIDSIKRLWLRIEGRAVSSGWRLPIGRSILALCRA